MTMKSDGRSWAAGVVALAAAYFLSQFYRSFLPVMYPVLSTDIGLDAEWLSLASGAWYIVFAAAQFPVGWALDRFGPRLTASVLLGFGGGGGALVFALAQGPEAIVLAMGLIGIGCAPVLMASFFIFARAFRADRFATYAATLVGIGSLGNVFAAAPLSELVLSIGWRGTSLGLVGATLLVALACGFLVRDPEALPSSEEARRGGLREVLAIRELWLILPLSFISYAAVANIRGAWAGPYLAEVYGWGAGEIGRATFVMALGMAAGAVLYGPLDRIFGSQKWVNFCGNTLVVGLCVLLALRPDAPSVETVATFVALGVVGATYSIIMAHGRAFLPPHLIGRGVTLLNFFSIAGPGVMQILSGWVLVSAGGAEAGAPAFSTVFWFYAVTLSAALVLYLGSREQSRRPVASAE